MSGENTQSDQFTEWCVVELLGHRRLGGFVTEQTIAGQRFLRIDIPRRDGTMTTQLVNPLSIYCLTPTTEALARAVARENQPEPIHRWELPPAREAKRVSPMEYQEIREPDGDPTGEEDADELPF